MKTRYLADNHGQDRGVFIATLTAEYMAKTGFGVYAFMTPVAIDELFNSYLDNREPVSIFVKRYLRKTLE